jgi:hypothetical protein
MAEIVVPMRSTLTALMYEKLMKMKDSSEPAKEVSAATFSIALCVMDEAK